MTQDLRVYTSEYVATGSTNSVPINLNSFNPATDILVVFIDGIMATEGVDYSFAAGNQSIILTNAITSGEQVDFLAFITNGVELDVSEFGQPQSRNEAILQNLLGGNNPILYPFSRIEVLLLALLQKTNVDASNNENVMAVLENIKTDWSSYSTGITNVPNVQADGPVAGVIVYKYSDDYGAVLIISYHPMFPHPAYCRLFAGEWTTPYWL